jgi:antitoxin component YwqK of YwqJK toxin-antitoxin module
MLENKNYTNGQKVHELKGDKLTYYYKNGKVKAEGLYINDLMEGEWIFYRETGQLWQVANFKHSMKHGSWVRYGRNDKIEYQEDFIENKIVKK